MKYCIVCCARFAICYNALQSLHQTPHHHHHHIIIIIIIIIISCCARFLFPRQYVTICYNSCTTPSIIKSFKPFQGCQALLQALTSTDSNKKVSKVATHGADDLLLLILTYGFSICVVYSLNPALNTHTDRDIYEVGLWLQSTI